MSKNFAFTWQPYQHKVPIFDERNGQDFISYGIDNDYPYYLLNLYRRSAKHNAIINGKVGFILGKGWTSEDPKAAAFMDSPNFPNDYDSLDDLTQKTTMDLEVFNGMALYVTWANNGTIASLEHCQFEKVRVNKRGDMFFVADWYDAGGVRQYPKKTDIETIPAFDPNNRIGKQLFYYKVYSPSVKNYPLPEYLGGTAYIELDVEIANFAINEIKNNFFPSAFINFPNGIPMPEEQDDIERAMFAKFGGSDNAGRWMFNFSDGKELAPDITILPTSDLDKRYQQLEKTVEQNIFVAHRVTSPMLFGVKTEGQLGGKNEMVESYEIFKATYIESRVQCIEKNYNYLAAFNGVSGLTLQAVEPVTEQLTEAALLQILTKDELREKAGFEPNEVQELGASRLVVDAINSLSPLVANKVLESMSPNEIRLLAGLPPKEGGEVIAAPEGAIIEPVSALPVELGNNFLAGLSASQQDKMLRVVRKYSQGAMTKEQAAIMLQGFGLPAEQVDIFLGGDNDHTTEFSAQDFESVAMAFGEDADGFEVLRSLPIRFNEDGSMRFEFEADAVNRPIDKKILAEVKKSGKVEADAISRKIDVPLEKVAERIQYLIEKGRITIENKIARIANEPDDDVKIEFEVRYRYDWRPEFQASKPANTSREFCQTLMKLNKLYTRQDIDQMSSIMGYSVWDRRGEWYTIPGTNVARPSCRHVWNQQIVRRVGNKIQEVKL
jgi:DNA-binding Lrp family transcriptional regulator